MIELSKDLKLPADAVTQTFALLAMRGAGKSNTARRMAEQMFRSRLPFVAVDPVGSWWGLRSSLDGKAPGLAVPIFGGRRGDVPLERTAGNLIADLVVDKRLSCVLDLSEFESENAKKAFLLDFSTRLYRRNEAPLHLFLEEADDYIPQRPMRDEAQLLRAWENIVRRGRARGLGITLITQRSAVLNKNVLTQVETLIAMRATSPQDRDAIEAWIEYHQQSADVLESLGGLDDGEAWVWSPHWLKVMKRVQILRSETFDSGSTPKSGTAARAPATLADVDLEGLRSKMAATIEAAKDSDPKELQKRIVELERELKASRRKEVLVEVPVFSSADIKHLQSALDKYNAAVERIESSGETVVKAIDRLCDLPKQFAKPGLPIQTVRNISAAASQSPNSHAVAARVVKNSADYSTKYSGDIPRGELAVLTAIAQHETGVTRQQLTVLTGYKRSTRNAYLQRLLEKTFIREPGRIVVTDAGIKALGPDFEPLPTGDALREWWLPRLPEGERKLLSILIAAYPSAVDRDDLSEGTGYARSSRNAYLQRLAARELVTGESGGNVKASEMLFG